MIPVARLYERQLIEEGVMTLDECNQMRQGIIAEMEEAYKQSKSYKYKAEDWVTEEWEKIKVLDVQQAKISGVKIDRLKEVGAKISHLPEDKSFHRLVRKIFEQRAKTIAEGKNIDWGTAEALAFATLI